MALVVVGANGIEDPTSEESMIRGQSGKVMGVIKPPPDIRAVVDKTAQFVARHGKDFEQKIIEKASTGESNSSKFNFMRPHDPYNAYYEFKIKEFEENGGVPPPKPPPPAAVVETPHQEESKSEPGPGPAGIVRKQKMNPIALALAKKSGGKPNPSQFTLVHPTNLSAMDIDIIKLSAQYTAVSGRNFLAGLAQREQRNPQFDFLKPTHLLFSYFTSLVDAYSKVLTPSDQQRSMIEQSSRDGILERVVERWSYERMERIKRDRERADTTKMQQLYMSVDWHDFVLVETIDFPEDEVLENSNAQPLPPPAAAREEEMDMDMDQEPPVTPAPLPTHIPVQLGEDETDEITVVRNYRPDVSSGKASELAEMIDPITGRSVPVSEMSEHMRISLLDPKWRVEQQRMKEKTAQETLAEGENIASALQSFAKQRGDIFGSTEEEEEAMLNEQAHENSQLGKDEKLVWDGTSASAAAVQAQSLNRLLEQQQAQQLQLQQQQQAQAAPTPTPPAPVATQVVGIPAQLRNTIMIMPPPNLPPPNMPPSTLPPPNLPPPNMPPNFSLPPSSLPGYPPIFPNQSAADIEPVSKKARIDPSTGLMSESDYASMISLPLTVNFALAADIKAGAKVSMSFDDSLISIKDVKDRLASTELDGLPVNKFQLKSSSLGFLKDRLSIAHYNIKNEEVLEVSRKKR